MLTAKEDENSRLLKKLEQLDTEGRVKDLIGALPQGNLRDQATAHLLGATVKKFCYLNSLDTHTSKKSEDGVDKTLGDNKPQDLDVIGALTQSMGSSPEPAGSSSGHLLLASGSKRKRDTPEGSSAATQGLTLIEMTKVLHDNLGVEGNVKEQVEEAVKQLGISTEGMTLIEQARACVSALGM